VKMKEIKLIIPDDTLVVSVTLVSKLMAGNITVVKIEAFSGSETEREIKWDEQDGGAE